MPEIIESVTVRFAGDSGDGMQITGDRLANLAATLGHDVITLADFPAEIRAPAGTTYGVSSYQVRFGDSGVMTPGDDVDVLVAMGPAALVTNRDAVRKGGVVILNEDAFNEKNYGRADLEGDPSTDAMMDAFTVHRIPMNTMVRKALDESPLSQKEKDRSKNFFALGLVCWLLERPVEKTMGWLDSKFAKRPDVAEANKAALREGWNAGNIRELFSGPLGAPPKEEHKVPGTYRFISGNAALAMGLIAAGDRANRKLFFGSYPITPASDVLHELARDRNFPLTVFQAEDEIAAVGAAVGASFAGSIGITCTSGPGMALKTEFIGLAVMTELPLVVLDIMRAGPSTGLPTKTEQSDLLMALGGRNGDSPVIVLAPTSPADCFDSAYEAVRLAIKFMTPVILLSDGFLANGNEAWRIPGIGDLPPVVPTDQKVAGGNGKFLPYGRDPDTLARPWVVPGTPGKEHRIGGLEKEDGTGNVSYDSANHEKMVALRSQKVSRAARDYAPLKVDGPEQGRLLVLGWGSSKGAIGQAKRRLAAKNIQVSRLHLRHIHPFPEDLEKVLEGFDRVLVPEINAGQLIFKLRGEFPGVKFEPFNRITGQPFRAVEIEQSIIDMLERGAVS